MNTAVLGKPQEWFNDGFVNSDSPALGCLPPRLRGTLDVNAYVHSVVDESDGRPVGLQLSVYQAIMVREMLDGTLEKNLISATYYLRRRDLLAQAVSLARSVLSGRFHSFQDDPAQLRAFNEVVCGAQTLLRWLEFLLDTERRFSELFSQCAISPTSLFYEDLVENPTAILNRIAGDLQAPQVRELPPFALVALRDSRSSDLKTLLRDALPEHLESALKSRAL